MMICSKKESSYNFNFNHVPDQESQLKSNFIYIQVNLVKIILTKFILFYSRIQITKSICNTFSSVMNGLNTRYGINIECLLCFFTGSSVISTFCPTAFRMFLHSRILAYKLFNFSNWTDKITWFHCLFSPENLLTQIHVFLILNLCKHHTIKINESMPFI